MKKYICLLRGINVSGQKPIKMSQLKIHFEELGYNNVQTYIQSGNVVFTSKIKDQTILRERIENKIKREYGFHVPALVINENKLDTIISKNPFDLENIDLKKHYIVYLFNSPKSELIKEASKIKSDSEQFVLNEDIIYFYSPEGYGRTKFNNSFFENKLKVNATTRNWRTTLKLHAILSEMI